MFKAKKQLLIIILYVVCVSVFIFSTVFLVPSNDLPFSFKIGVVAFLFAVLLIIASLVAKSFTERFRQDALHTKETKILSDFIARIRFAYSLEDLILSMQQELEDKGDCSILFIDRSNNYVIYNSPDRLCCYEDTLHVLELNFSRTIDDGVYFIDQDLGVTSDMRFARGFFLVHEKMHLYVFCRYTRLFDPIVFPVLLDEFLSFLKRSSIITELSRISELSKEWNMVAETQRSFLPAVMPEQPHLDLGAYFRPLVNVSGDYYTVLPITPAKTLVLLGDVSGKGLAAALVMGIIINTVKNMQNREDLPSMIKAVDRAIKAMRFDDKYTVMFLGIIDTDAMEITYINASMADPIIITKSPGGFNVKPLESNCSLVGIVELDEVTVEKKKLFYDDMILIATDGVSEVMNDDGVELGDTELYKQTVQNSAFKSAKHFINDIADLVMEYNGNKKLRDDVTMLAIKVER